MQSFAIIPTDTPGAPNVYAPTPTPIYVPDGIKTKTDFSSQAEFEDEEIAPTPTPNSPPPDVVKEFGGNATMEPFRFFDLSWLHRMLSAANDRLLPAMVKENTIHADPNKLHISVSKIQQCVAAAGNNPEKNYAQNDTSNTNAITKNLPILSQLYEDTRTSASLFTKYSTLPNPNHTYNFDETTVVLETLDAPPCEDDVGTDHTQYTDTSMDRQFGAIAFFRHIFVWLEELTKTVFQPVDVTVRTFSPYTADDNCLTSGCTKEKPDLTYQSNEEREKITNAGGISNTFLPGSIDPMMKCDANGQNCKKDEIHGQRPNELTIEKTGSRVVKTRTEGTKEMENYANAQRCIIMPEKLQSSFLYGVVCGSATKKDVSCELPEFSESVGACGICNADSELGPLARKILTAAGTAFNVPASAIWATMLHEGGDWAEYKGQYTDENVEKWSLTRECGGKPMPRCDNNADTTQPPFGFIKKWFYNGDGENALWTAVQKVDPTRNTKDIVSRCNFMDAAFAAAKSLQQGASMTNSGATCGKYVFDGTQPSSCFGWTDTKFAQSQVAYAGQCPNNAIKEQVPYTIEDVVSWYNRYKCQ